MTSGVLVIGYGNTLRTDDGIGRQVAERLADDPRMAGVTVLGVHQLAPELALDFSNANLAVLIDASHELPAGTFTVEPVARAVDAVSTWSHHISPASLIGLAVELYGWAPDVFMVSVGVASVEEGDRLSPVVEAAMSLVVDAVVAFVAAQAAQAAEAAQTSQAAEAGSAPAVVSAGA